MTGRQFLTGVLIVLVCGVRPALAQQKQGWKRQATPYGNLFQTPDLKASAEKQSVPASPLPRVVGGMPLIPLDPCVDPKIFIGQRPACK